MLMLDADKILYSLSFATMADELAAMHREDIGLVDEMVMAITTCHKRPTLHRIHNNSVSCVCTNGTWNTIRTDNQY